MLLLEIIEVRAAETALPQASKYWVFRGFEGETFDPPQAFTSFATAKAVCKRQADCGQSVFIGLPARAAVDAVCASAGFPSVTYS